MTSAGLPNSHTPLEPSEAPPGVRRLVLVPAAGSARGTEPVRRYRMARVRVEPRGTDSPRAERFAHLKDFHD